MRVAIAFAALSLTIGALTPLVSHAMEFERVTVGGCAQRQCMAARGPIYAATLDQFTTFVRANKLSEGAIVFLDSLGGDLGTGIALGQEIRKRGLDTYVAGYDRRDNGFTGSSCASACVYMFIGGVRRGAAEDSRVGVHQLSMVNPNSVTEGVTNAQWLMGMAAEHIQAMGGNPQLLSLALKTPASGIYWLSRKELRQDRAITLDVGLAKASGGLAALSFFDATR